MVIKLKGLGINNKRGWLKIVEAVIAILIVFGAVLYIVSKQDYSNYSSDSIYQKQQEILGIIAKNDTLRGMVINEDTNGVEGAIGSMIPVSWNYSTCICNITLLCSPNTPHDKEVYVEEAVITSTLQTYSPKKLRFFVWMK